MTLLSFGLEVRTFAHRALRHTGEDAGRTGSVDGLGRQASGANVVAKWCGVGVS